MMNNLREWIDLTKAILDEISSIKPSEDRLTTFSNIVKCHSSITRTMNGWTTWIRNPIVMDSFKKEELDDILSNLRKVSILLLTFDLETSRKKEKEWKTIPEEKTPKREKLEYIR